MSQTVITQAFEALKAQEAANGGVLTLDEFVFASVPNLNITDPIDRTEGLPPAAQIVHRQAVSKTGMVNSNAVVYSVVLGADVGDFEFNWVGLLNKASGVVAMIVHAPSQKKIKTASGQQGNVLTRSFLMEYNGASQQTQIITPADTWQIDFTARLNGVDERIRQENLDAYGPASFMNDGFLVSGVNGSYQVKKGVAYIEGLRAELLFDQAMAVAVRPSKIWVDVCWRGTLTSVWAAETKLTVAETLENYITGDEQHYVFAIADILSDGSVIDLRQASAMAQLVGLPAEPNVVPYFNKDSRLRNAPLSDYIREMFAIHDTAGILARLELSTPGGSGNIDGLMKPVTWKGFSGGADHAGIGASDAAFAAANATGLSVFIPAGTYRISGDTDMSACEMVFGKGVSINVQAGVTLTVGRIRCGLHPVFSGAGNVLFTTSTDRAYPEWFGAMRNIDSTQAITKCQNACAPNKITVSLTDDYLISDLLWDRRVPAEASARSAFKPYLAARNGMKLTGGNSVGKSSFPAISGFPGHGLRVVGTCLANIYVSEIQNCGDAVILETSGADTTLLNTEINLTSISACTNAVVFVADSVANVMQGNKVYVNFIANCTNSVLFRDNGLSGPGPNWDSNQVITQAIDPTPSRPTAVMLKNECSYAINRLVFRVETWAGGMADTGKFIEGRFNDLDAYINLSQNPKVGQFAYVGATNRVDFSSARGRDTTPVTTVNKPNSLNNPESLPPFNGGIPLSHNIVKLKYIPTVDWPNNTQKQAYIYHQLTDQNTNAFTVMPPDSGSLRGCTIDSVIDNSQTNPNEIVINLRNVSGVTIQAGVEIEFKLRVGLY